MLDGRYPSKEFGELRARIVWDRARRHVRARRGSRQLAITNAGTIPDRGLYAVTLPDGRRVGELDEEMVYEARPGQAFLLGASTWRIEEITRDRVIVTPAPGAPGAVPFWKGDTVGRPVELGTRDRRVLALGSRAGARHAGARLRPRRARRAQPARLPARAAGRNARDPQRAHDRARALPRRDRRLAPVHALPLRRARARRLGPRAVRPHPRAPRPGGRRDLVRRRHRHAPACRSRRRRARRDRVPADEDGEASWPARGRPRRARAARPRRGRGGAHRRARRLRPVRRALSRERRPRAADPARLPRPAHAAVAAAAEGPDACSRSPAATHDFPIVLETYRECLRDVLDVPGLQQLLRALHTREVSLVEVETADRLAVRVLAAVRLRRHLHVRGRHAQRRAPRRRAVARPRAAARAARPGGAARADRPRQRSRASRTSCSTAPT